MLDRTLAAASQVKMTAKLDPETAEDISIYAHICRRVSIIRSRCVEKLDNIVQTTPLPIDEWTPQTGSLADDMWLREIINSDNFILDSMSTWDQVTQMQIAS